MGKWKDFIKSNKSHIENTGSEHLQICSFSGVYQSGERQDRFNDATGE